MLFLNKDNFGISGVGQIVTSPKLLHSAVTFTSRLAVVSFEKDCESDFCDSIPLSLSTFYKMCPHANGDSLNTEPSQMVAVDATSSNGASSSTNGHVNKHVPPRNPYAPRYADFLSNVSNFKIIESTLRGVVLTIFSWLDPF